MERNGFPLEGLIEKATRALGGIEQSSARVQERPDVRTIRYYASLGLLDKPLFFQGRTALYGERHVAQLVAIKRLQAQQLSLQEVQERLLGLTDEALFELAKLPRAEAAAPPVRRRHWTALPIPLPTKEAPEARSLISIKLSPAVTLSVEGLARTPSQAQLIDLQEAARALLAQLKLLQDEAP